MNRTSLFVYVAWLACFMSISCREESDEVLSYAYDYHDTSNFDEASKSFEGQFKAIWTALNCNYPIWDYERKFGVDWDKVYDDNISRFQALDDKVKTQHESVTNDELEKLYTEILSPLHDGHFYAGIKNLLYSDSTIHVCPNNIRIEERENAFERVSTFNRLQHYLETTDGYLRVTDYAESGYLRGQYVYACFDEEIVYLCLRDMSITKEGMLKPDIAELWNRWFNKIQELFYKKLLKGIIIDLRGNHGGSGDSYQFVMGALQKGDKEMSEYGMNCYKIGYLRAKSGIGRLDYLPPCPCYHNIYQKQHAVIDSLPITILADSNTASAAEHICLAAKEMNNGCIIGTRTLGAFASLTNVGDYAGENYKITYSGIVGSLITYSGIVGSLVTPFYLYIPAFAFFTNEGEILESVGIEPDIEVKYDFGLYADTGRDNQLERAVEYIRTGK